MAGKQYQGDGLSVTATPDGARLRCVFQRMEGQVTREGLWLTSTAENSNGERFRVVAVAVGREAEFDPRDPLTPSLSPSGGEGATAIAGAGEEVLPRTGIVEVADKLARFIRPGLTEEYSVSVDGVRQDFIIEHRPAGEGQLRVELEVSGARAEPLVQGARPVRYSAGGTAAEQKDLLSHGARLVLDGSGRKIAYSRLRVVDAEGKELSARLEFMPDGARRSRRFDAEDEVCSGNFPTATELRMLKRPEGRDAARPAALGHERCSLAVVVDDAAATYPVRIDPTFSDADWISLGGIPGANSTVRAAVIDAFGNLFIGGDFTIVGDVFANRVAKWDGSAWSALGTGLNEDVYSLEVSGTDLYAGGYFTTAGGATANRIAKWDGSAWSALGSGMNAAVFALAVSGTNLYAGGSFTTAGGTAALRIATWNGNSWSVLESGMNNSVYALAVSGTDLYAGGLFSTAGGIVANHIGKWDGSTWSVLGSGLNSTVDALVVSDTNLYAGGFFTRAGGSAANYIAKWNGSAWSPLGSGMNGNVSALAVSGTDLYAGGYFTTAGGIAIANIAKWNGSVWSAMGSGMNSFGVYSLAVSGTDLYAGGQFTTAGGIAANAIAKWNGSAWSALGSGMNNNVSALAVSGTNLYAGGDFTTAGDKVSAYAAMANIGAVGGRFSTLAYSPATGFQFTFSDATTGQSYRIQTSPSLAGGSWIDFTNFTYTGPVVITDASAVPTTNKFYRAVTP